MAKWQKTKKLVAKFANVSGDNGWTLSKNDATERYDLRKDSNLIMSDVGLSPCVHCAAKHGVKWETDPVIEWVVG